MMSEIKKITIRLKEHEYREIQARADAANISMNRYLIEAALGSQRSDLRLRSDLMGQLCRLQNVLLTVSDADRLRQDVRCWRAETIRRIGG